MANPKKIALVGIGGFSKYHYDRIKELEKHGVVRLSSVLIRASSVHRYQEMIRILDADGVQVYNSFEAMLDGEKGRADIISLPTEISEHCNMSIASLYAGYHVICEKPVAGTIEECKMMKEAQEKTNKVLAICFQNIYSSSIQRLKRIALSGALGQLKSAKSYVLWQRATAYYSSWRGKLIYEGKIINDCPLMNATAHYLNNMLYIAGPSLHESAQPAFLYGENYRVKEIESCDTQYLRVITTTGVKLQFITSHATDIRVDPHAEYYFEQGKILWTLLDGAVVYVKEGEKYVEQERFNNDTDNLFSLIYKSTCEAIDSGTNPLSVIQNSYQHILCVNKSFESGPIKVVPEEFIGSTHIFKDDDCLKAGDNNRYIKGIHSIVQKMMANDLSYYEAGCPWAVKSRDIEVKI